VDEVKKFLRAKGAGVVSVAALAAAGLTVSLAGSAVPSAPLTFSLMSNMPTTTISSTLYAAPACSGAPVLLDPGMTRCLIFTVHNGLTVPETIQTITMSLDGSFPAPPSGCAASDITFPKYSGSLPVAGGGTVHSPPLAITLLDRGNQSNCENTALHFVYASSAQYTDSSITKLAVSPTPLVEGRPMTFTATVIASNAAADPTGPFGTVLFYACSNAACPSSLLLGSGSIGANGQATFTTTNLDSVNHFFEAEFTGAGTDFAASSSGILSTSVSPATGSPAPSGPLGFSGADLEAIVVSGLALFSAGSLLVVFTRRRTDGAP
jgi:hypothetical protein